MHGRVESGNLVFVVHLLTSVVLVVHTAGVLSRRDAVSDAQQRRLTTVCDVVLTGAGAGSGPCSGLVGDDVQVGYHHDFDATIQRAVVACFV